MLPYGKIRILRKISEINNYFLTKKVNNGTLITVLVQWPTNNPSQCIANAWVLYYYGGILDCGLILL